MYYKPIGSIIEKLSEAESTNLYLCSKSKLCKIEEGTIIWTEKQTNGRGQQGNIWYAKEGESLTFSFIFYPNFLYLGEQYYLSKAFSIAVCKYFFDFFNLKTQIKWPNDILFNGKKICGILIENTILGNTLKNSVVGIGININNKVFPGELSATSVLLNTVTHYDINKSLDAIIPYLNEAYLQLTLKQWKQIDKSYHELLYGHEKSLQFFSSEYFEGKIKKVDEFGFLHIETHKGIKKYAFKEIVFC
jgi:BirA family biotin operon repressor/biotin-[acetyl-CoA-carboxylase] ligase